MNKKNTSQEFTHAPALCPTPTIQLAIREKTCGGSRSKTGAMLVCGFTFVELSVVIGIIILLTGVILVNVNAARIRAADATIKGQLAIIQSRAEIYYGSHTDYSYETDACNWQLFGDVGNGVNDDIVSKARVAAENASDHSAACAASDDTTSSGEPAKSWALSVPLKSDPAKYWCVDSSGNYGERNTPVNVYPGQGGNPNCYDPNDLSPKDSITYCKGTVGIAQCPSS